MTCLLQNPEWYRRCFQKIPIFPTLKYHSFIANILPHRNRSSVHYWAKYSWKFTVNCRCLFIIKDSLPCSKMFLVSEHGTVAGAVCMVTYWAIGGIRMMKKRRYAVIDRSDCVDIFNTKSLLLHYSRRWEALICRIVVRKKSNLFDVMCALDCIQFWLNWNDHVRKTIRARWFLKSTAITRS